MIYAYELSGGLKIQAEGKRKSFPHPNDLGILKEKIHDFLPTLGIRTETTLFKKVMDRIAFLDQEDREMVFCIKNFIDKKLSNIT